MERVYIILFKALIFKHIYDEIVLNGALYYLSVKFDTFFVRASDLHNYHSYQPEVAYHPS